MMERKPWVNYRLQAINLRLLMPFSPIWWIWNLILITAITINILLIPYGIGFETNFSTHPLIIFSLIVYLIDIPVRIRSGMS